MGNKKYELPKFNKSIKVQKMSVKKKSIKMLFLKSAMYYSNFLVFDKFCAEVLR